MLKLRVNGKKTRKRLRQVLRHQTISLILRPNMSHTPRNLSRVSAEKGDIDVVIEHLMLR